MLLSLMAFIDIHYRYTQLLYKINSKAVLLQVNRTSSKQRLPHRSNKFLNAAYRSG